MFEIPVRNKISFQVLITYRYRSRRLSKNHKKMMKTKIINLHYQRHYIYVPDFPMLSPKYFVLCMDAYKRYFRRVFSMVR